MLYYDDDTETFEEKEIEDDKYTLVGVDGNCFAIMGYVVSAMKKEGKSKDEIDNYLKDAKSSDYDHLLAVSQDVITELNRQLNLLK